MQLWSLPRDGGCQQQLALLTSACDSHWQLSLVCPHTQTSLCTNTHAHASAHSYTMPQACVQTCFHGHVYTHTRRKMLVSTNHHMCAHSNVYTPTHIHRCLFPDTCRLVRNQLHIYIQAQATHAKTSFKTHKHEYIPTGAYTQTYFPKQACAHKHLCAYLYTHVQACPHNCTHSTSMNRYPISHTQVFGDRNHRCIQSNTCKHTQPHTLFVHFSTQPHLYTHAPPQVCT